MKPTCVNVSSSSHCRIYAPQMREGIKKEDGRRVGRREANAVPTRRTITEKPRTLKPWSCRHVQGEQAGMEQRDSKGRKLEAVFTEIAAASRTGTLPLPCVNEVPLSFHALLISWGYSFHPTENSSDIHQGNKRRKCRSHPCLNHIPAIYSVPPCTLTGVSPVSQNSFMTQLTDLPRESSCKLEKAEARMWTKDSA